MKITVLGAGAWGTALAHLLCEGVNEVTLWGHDASRLQAIAQSRSNHLYLPGIQLSSKLICEPDLALALNSPDVVVMAVPSKVFRSLAGELGAFQGIVVSATKGIEAGTGLTMCGILAECAPGAKPAALSGPTLALEVASGVPSAITVASGQADVATFVQQLFHRPRFRVYTSTDLKGVEMGGALKNVIAIAAGVCDGLGFGDNSKAALVTRGLAEMRRLGVAVGSRHETYTGLSGLGDLMVTCFSRHSRNRSFGEQIGRGKTVSEILSVSKSVVEGYPTAASAHELIVRLGVDAPILTEMKALLYVGKNPALVLEHLTARDSKAESP